VVSRISSIKSIMNRDLFNLQNITIVSTHLKNISQIGSFPEGQGENTTYLSCHHLETNPRKFSRVIFNICPLVRRNVGNLPFHESSGEDTVIQAQNSNINYQAFLGEISIPGDLPGFVFFGRCLGYLQICHLQGRKLITTGLGGN